MYVMYVTFKLYIILYQNCLTYGACANACAIGNHCT